MRKTNIHEDITRFELFNTNLKKIIQEQKRNYFFKNFEASDCKQKWKHINNLLNKEQKIKQIQQNTVKEFLTHFSKTFSTCNANIINPCDENHFTVDSIYLNKANDSEVLKCFSMLKNAGYTNVFVESHLRSYFKTCNVYCQSNVYDGHVF